MPEQIINDKQMDPFEELCEYDLRIEVDNVLRSLTHRERRVIQLRFGIDDGRQRSYEETGKMFGVTGERIRQIELKALRKLRHPSRSKKLADYLYVSSEFHGINYVDIPGTHRGGLIESQVRDQPLTVQQGMPGIDEVQQRESYKTPKSCSKEESLLLGKLPWLVSARVREILVDPDYQSADYEKKHPERINLWIGNRDYTDLVKKTLVDLMGLEQSVPVVIDTEALHSQAESLFYLEEIAKLVDPVYLDWWRKKELAYFESFFEFLSKGVSRSEAKRLAREEQEIWLSEDLGMLQKYPMLAPLYGIDFK